MESRLNSLESLLDEMAEANGYKRMSAKGGTDHEDSDPSLSLPCRSLSVYIR